MYDSIWGFFLLLIGPVIISFVIYKLWRAIMRPSKPTFIWQPGWQKYIWENNIPIREATYDERDYQFCSGSPIENKKDA